MVPEPFDFSCAILLPNGIPADVQQTDIQRGRSEDRTYFVAVRPHSGQGTYMGALHLSRTSLRNLEACPGDTRSQKSWWVADALQTWVKTHGLAADFALDLTVDMDKDHVCRVGITLH